jgi:TRAP-type C4-dicarboxylate transport system permease small subunit
MEETTAAPDTSWFAKLAKVSIAVASVALVGVAAVEGWQVFARYVLNHSPSWTEPLALLFMSTAVMCGAAVGVRTRRHFGFFMLSERGSPRVQRALKLFAAALAVCVGILFALAGAKLSTDSWTYEVAGAPLPQGVVYIPVCVGGILIAIFALEQFKHILRAAPALKSE